MRWTEQDLANYQGKARGGKARALSLTPERRVEIASMGGAAKRAKYRNVKTTDLQGVVHDSSKEHRRWQELQLREIAGEITELRHHVPFAAVVEGEHICDYEADFVYREGAALIVEDVKPKDAKFRKTPAYRLFRLKQKLVQAIHKFQIREV